MDFDPTKDYYGMDMSIETNVVKWNYWEFIKNLVTLSSDSDSQKEIIGFGAVADEMAIDFDTYYTLQSKRYLEYDLLDIELISKLDQIDTFLENRGGEKMPDFWDDDLLDSHPDWKIVRIMSKEILRLMNFDDLKIEIERSIKKNQSSKGEPLVIEGTKTRLIKQTPANNGYKA